MLFKLTDPHVVAFLGLFWKNIVSYPDIRVFWANIQDLLNPLLTIHYPLLTNLLSDEFNQFIVVFAKVVLLTSKVLSCRQEMTGGKLLIQKQWPEG